MAAPAWGVASRLLAAAGVAADPSYVRHFTGANQRAVLTVAQRIQAAWRANDADRFADTFAENGSLLMRDEQLRGRAEIRAYLSQGFAGALRGAHVTGWPIEVRFLARTVAMVVTEGGIVMPGETGLADRNLIRATWIVVRDPDGRLQLMSHHSSPVRG